MPMSPFKKYLIIFVAAVVLIGSGILTILYNASFSEGFRAGKVMKISKKGFIFKTYEGQLDVGGLGATGGQMSSVWEFSVDANHEDLIRQLEAVSLSGERVQLYFEEKFVQFAWRGDTKYFITKIERIK